jgi:hypothetical protein
MDATQRAMLTSLAAQPSPTAVPMLAALETRAHQFTENAHTLAAEVVCDAGEWAMKHKTAAKARPRNVGQFVPRKAGRALRAVLPAWAAGVFTACLVIPGPFDEAAFTLAALVLVVARFPRAASAWRGGKTHRAPLTDTMR